MKNSPGQRIHTLFVGSTGRRRAAAVDCAPRFDDLSLAACAIMLISGSVFVHAIQTPMSRYATWPSVSLSLEWTGAQIGGALWRTFKTIETALE